MAGRVNDLGLIAQASLVYTYEVLYQLDYGLTSLDNPASPSDSDEYSGSSGMDQVVQGGQDIPHPSKSPSGSSKELSEQCDSS